MLPLPSCLLERQLESKNKTLLFCGLPRYPSGGWAVLKVFLWLLGIVTGMLVGKFFFHKLVLRRWMKLSMFREDRGSWMVMFLATLLSLFIFSLIYNAFLSIGGDDLEVYKVTSFLGMKNKTFMKAAGMGTWMGDFVTAWMVTDMMLQVSDREDGDETTNRFVMNRHGHCMVTCSACV